MTQQSLEREREQHRIIVHTSDNLDSSTSACELTTINSKLISFSQSWAIACWVVRPYWLVSHIRLQFSSPSSSSTVFFPFLFSVTGGMKSSSSIMSSKKYSWGRMANRSLIANKILPWAWTSLTSVTLHTEEPTSNLQHWTVTKIAGEHGGIDCGRHEDHSQIGVGSQHVTDHHQQEVSLRMTNDEESSRVWQRSNSSKRWVGLLLSH